MHHTATAAGDYLPHGFCYLWNRPLLLTHLSSDLLIGLSYVAISLSLVYLVRRARNEIPFSILFLAFGLFIVACGGTHFMEVWTLWHGSYWASAGVKVVTAAASVATAAAMPVMVPRVLSTIHDARRAHESAVAVGRAAALEESNASLRTALAEAQEARAAALALVDALRRTQAERDERERYFRRVFESDMIGIAFWGADGEIGDANDAFLRIVGYSREDHTQGRVHWREMTPPEWLPVDERALAEIAVRGTCAPFEKEYWRKDGTRVPVLIGASAFEGTNTRGVAFVLDVSDRWAAEAALRASERSLATTLDSIGDAVIATDTHGKVMRLNPVAEHLTGWSRAEAIGYPLEAVFHIVSEATGREVEHPVARVLREGTVVGLANHTLLVSRDGTTRPIADSGAPIRDERGETSGVVLVFRDQTDERQLEEVRINAVRLEEENRRAQEATRLKSEFLANMSHELRTPLNAIIGFTQIMYDGKVDPGSPEQHEYLGDVLTSAQHLLQVINDVLDLSKVEAGKLQLHPQPVDLSTLIDEVLGILRTGFGAKGLEVESQVDPELTDVVLDAGRFKQVLYNYVSNALKFTPEGGRIRVRVTAEGSAFRLEVEDTGVGIAPEDISRLFTAFEQLDSGASKRHAGTGLGLALVKRLVEAQGGSVSVRSTLGAGTTFHAILPRRGRGTTPSAGSPT